MRLCACDVYDHGFVCTDLCVRVMCMNMGLSVYGLACGCVRASVLGREVACLASTCSCIPGFEPQLY